MPLLEHHNGGSGESWTERWQELDRQAYKLAAEQLQADYHQKQRANATVQATLDAARTEVLDKLIRDELSRREMRYVEAWPCMYSGQEKPHEKNKTQQKTKADNKRWWGVGVRSGMSRHGHACIQGQKNHMRKTKRKNKNKG